MKSLMVLCGSGLLLVTQWVMAADIFMTQVIFEEVEPGLEPYTTRILVNKRYLRLDDGDDHGDFTLFDRVKGEVHNFNQEDQSEVIIQRGPAVELDQEIHFSVQRRALRNAPRVGNLVAEENKFFADEQLCKTSINFNGLLPDVVKALVQYQFVLMQQNRKTFDAIPQAVKTPCYLANNYFHQSAHLKAGLPVHVVDARGREKRLLDFEKIKKSSEIFQRLKGYRIYFPSL